MSYHHTLEAAVENIHEIEALVKGFPVNGKIPSIEIDLAMQKLRNLYELLLMMKENEVRVSPAENNTGESESIPNEPLMQVEESTKTTVTITSSVEEVKTLHEEDRGFKTETTDKKIISKKKTAEFKTLADQFHGGPTLLETLSETYKRESGTYSGTKQVTDLMAAIALNERFTFIRELFNNDRKAFESTIAKLNNAGNYETAYEYLTEYNWDMEDDSVKLLLDLLRRKYTE